MNIINVNRTATPLRAVAAALAAAALISLAACEAAVINDSQDGPTANQAPVSYRLIGSQCMADPKNTKTGRTSGLDSQTISFTLSDYFRDPDGDELTYEARVNNPNAWVVQVSMDGATLSIETVNVGNATVTVSATDGYNASVTQTFDVTVYGTVSGQSWATSGISLTDRTLFIDATYDGQDRRRFGEHPGVFVLSHLFNVRFADESNVEIAFDAEKFDRSLSSRLVDVFGQVYGRIPFFLRDRMPAIYVTKEGVGYSGAYHNRPFVEFNSGGVSVEDDLIGLDEHFLRIMIHELAHYLDARREGRFFDFRLWLSGDPGWASAAAADGEYITSYASTNNREDFAETMSAYLASRYHGERLCPAVIAHIENTIPNRLAYLDSILDDHGRMCPLVEDDC